MLFFFVICEINENVKRTFSPIHCQGTKEAKIVSAESTVEILRVARQTFLKWGNMNNVNITFARDGNSPFKVVTFSIFTLDQAPLPLLEACLECSFLDVQQHPLRFSFSLRHILKSVFL